MKFSKILFAFLFIMAISCNHELPKIRFGTDLCDFCKMTAMDRKFGAMLINGKGKALRFDSEECMLEYLKTDDTFKPDQFLVIDYQNPGVLLDAKKAFYLHGGGVNSPMGGHLAAFSTMASVETVQQQLGGEILLWSAVNVIHF
ncbi:MAG: nitrous oxide reductase accessory protein NosL [Chitinophagales bacterium]